MQSHSKATHSTLPPHLDEVVAELPPSLIELVRKLPPRLMDVLADAPVYVDRRTGAELLTHVVIPVSHRSLEAWPLPWQHANGKALCPTVAMFAMAYSKLVAAPVIMGGRRGEAQHRTTAA